MTKLEQVQKAIEMLSTIDDMILGDSKADNSEGHDRFMDLVHQKEGLHEFILSETGYSAYWTSNGYDLRP